MDSVRFYCLLHIYSKYDLPVGADKIYNHLGLCIVTFRQYDMYHRYTFIIYDIYREPFYKNYEKKKWTVVGIYS